MTTLLSLPNEVLIDIILLFDAVRDIKALQKVCTFLNRLVEQSQTLLYHLHKLIAGVVDLPSTASSQDRLDALRAREEAWDRLRFRHHETLLVTFQSAFLYDMADGEMVLIRDDQEGQAAGLVSFTLPSISQGLSRSVAEGTTMDTNLKLFDVSLSAKEDDLLVLFYTRVEWGFTDIYIRFHNRTTGKPHPLAAQPDVRILHRRGNFEPVTHLPVSFEIVGRWVVVAISSPLNSGFPDEMVRVAWKTGRCENIHSAPFKSFSDLLFLSETTLVVINLCAHTLDLFQLIEGKDDTHLRLKASFELPQLEKGVRVLAVESRGNRLVGSDPSALPSSPGPRWRFDPDESLVVFHFAFHHLSWNNFATLVVHPRAFLRSHITSLHPVDAVPWEHWGPVHARWFTHGTTYPKCLSGASAGQRLAMFTEKKMRVYDFNRLRARRKGCIDSGPDEGFDGWFIGGTPTSKLEMSVVEKEMENDYKGVMLDGERVFGIKVRPDGESIKCIDIFLVG